MTPITVYCTVFKASRHGTGRLLGKDDGERLWSSTGIIYLRLCPTCTFDLWSVRLSLPFNNISFSFLHRRWMVSETSTAAIVVIKVTKCLSELMKSASRSSWKKINDNDDLLPLLNKVACKKILYESWAFPLMWLYCVFIDIFTLCFYV